jgi:glutamine synthetase
MPYTVAEYIWLDSNKKLRSKTKIIKHGISTNHSFNLDSLSVPKFPEWDYDGSSTGQADGKKSEVILHPVCVYDNPLLNTVTSNVLYSKLVLCETYYPDGTPTASNTRKFCREKYQLCAEQEPWFGLEQEYFIFDERIETTPPKLLFYETSEHYCGVGKEMEYRKVAEEHMLLCMKANIIISGINAEVSKNQWEFQIGPSEGVKAADDLLIARFLLERVAEKYNLTISYEPKPFEHINGSGCHTNFSTVVTRKESDDNTGLKEIYRIINSLEKNHCEDIKHFGVSNETRLSGRHETSSYNHFSWGIGDRGSSVRINSNTHKTGYGYFEDRRPAANMDPYLVTGIIMSRVTDQ